MSHIYEMNPDTWNAVYDHLQERRDTKNTEKRQFSLQLKPGCADRWISLNYGLTVLGKESYEYSVRDERRLMEFLLRWT